MKQNKQCQLLLLSLAVAACFGSVQANPLSPQVVAGQASFQQQGNVFTVTNTPNTIINWQSFSVNANEVTRFLQQGADSKVLNRITGQDPSRILGTLQSNGQVYLINPNGILFGKEARIDVQGLAASSLGMSNTDFLAGRAHFSAQGAAGKVENQGSISTGRGGQVYLVAPDVTNSGIIHAPGGAVMLAAGHSVQLVDAANPALQVVVSAPADSALNLGQVVAQGGRIGIFGALVNQRGLASADSAVLGENGKVMLRSSVRTMVEGGSRTAARGGEVAILGPQVGVTGNARIDASAAPEGAGNGGSVLVGGDYRGANAGGPNARQVYIGKDALLSADAGTTGQGGKVVVWADDVARVHGTIAARGGAAGGDGGLVETSAQQLEMAGLRVDASAAQGQRGQWLLDPYDIVVRTSPNVPGTLSDVATFAAGAATGATEVATSLLDGAQAQVNLQAKHDITFSDAVSISAPAVGLTAQAGNNINVNAAIATNGGSVKLIANDSASGAASGSGAINVGASGAIRTGVGSIHLYGAGLSLGSGAELAGQELRLYADKIDFAGGASASAVTSAYIAPNSAAKAITVGGTGAGTLELGSATLAAISAQEVSIGSSGGGALTVAGPLDLSASNAGTGLLKLAGATVQVASDLKPRSVVYLESSGAIGGAGTITGSALYASGDSIALTGANQVNELAAAATGDISFRNATGLNVGSFGDSMAGVQSSSGNVTLEASSLTQGDSSPVRAAGTLTLSNSGQVNLNINYDNHATKLVAENIGGLDYIDSGSVDIGALSLAASATGGTLRVDAGGSLTVSGAVDSRGGMLDLLGANVAVGSSAVVKGRDLHLTAHYEGLSTAGGSQIEGNYVTLESTSSMLLGGTVKGVTDTGGAGGEVALVNPGGTIRVGGSANELSALAIDGASLSRISAPRVRIDNVGGETANGASIAVGNLDVGTAGFGTLHLRSGNGIDFSGTVTLPGTAGLLANAAGNITSSATLAANTVMLNGQSINFSGGGIAANGGAGKVSLYSAGDIELGGSAPTAGSPSFLSSAALAGINASALHIGSGASIKVGAAIGNANLDLGLEAGSGSTSGPGTLTVAAPVLAKHIRLEADVMAINADVTATMALLAPATAGKAVTVGAACANTGGCLSLTQLDRIVAATVGIGSSDTDGSGALTLAGAANLNAATIRLGLLSNTSITQDASAAAAGLTVQELGVEANGPVLLDHASNQVGKLAAKVAGGDFTFRNAQSLAIVHMQGGSALADTDYDVNGVYGSGIVNFNIIGSLTTDGTAPIAANELKVMASGSIGSATAPLLTKAAQLYAETTATSGIAPIRITNNQGTPGQLLVQRLKVNTGNAGAVTLDNYGATVVPSTGVVKTDSGNIAITAHSPLTVDGTVETVSGDISLVAGNSGSSGDDLTIGSGALVKSASGNISLSAGSDITYPAANVLAPNGTIKQAANQNQPPVVVPLPPTLAECVANPALSGCQEVLPPIDQCVANPTLAGCQVVLPPIDQCVANPALAGCQVVLPPLSQCVANPTLAGCQAVLPPIDQCVANPALAGCQVVLPPLGQCVANPSLAGCQAVLPPVSQCVANPSLAGCQAVLPPLDQCVANPALAGCQAVLPTVAQCVTNPSQAGCQVVLPPLSQCLATPTLAGCQVVLPPLSQCVATPALAGCQAVLPALSQCVATPSLAGCQVVLPPLSQCVATPSLAGCQAVLPPLSQCVALPSQAGCQAVLPTFDQCVSSPALAGCSVVLPSFSQCVASPVLAGCQAVLPTLTQCAANPALAGCSAVLPAPDLCTVNPNLAACQILLPPTESEPVKPVQQAVNEVVKEVNTVTEKAKQADAATGGSSTGGVAALSSSPDDDKKKTAGDSVAKQEEKAEVTKYEPVKKMYCN